MRSKSGRVDRAPASGDRASCIPAPISGALSHLKNAWPFALVGFVVGLLAAVIVNMRNRRLGVTSRAQLPAPTSTSQPGAVGFVSNRAPLAKADLAFRLSLHDMEPHPPDEVASSSMWTVNWHGNIHKYPRKSEHAAGETLPHAQSGPAAPATPGIGRADQREPGCASERVQAEFISRIQPPNLPAWFLDRGPSGSPDITHISAAENVEPAAAQIPSDAASRMERLRGLFANVDLENLHRSQVRGPVPQNEPVRRANPSASAQAPKILSPREFVPVKEPKRPSDSEIHILPSKRGQYGS